MFVRRWLWPILGLAGLLLFLVLSPIAEPDAQVDLTVTPAQALEQSRTFLTGQGFDLTDYDHTISFSSDENAVVYIQRTFPLEQANVLSKEYHLWYWSVRWFKPGERTEYQVGIRTDSPELLFFRRQGFPEEAPGARLDDQPARKQAEAFATAHGFNLREWVLVDARRQDQPGRADHHFAWQKQGLYVGEAWPKLAVDIQGDTPAGLSTYLAVPETFQREQARLTSVGTGLATASMILLFALWAVALAYSIRFALRRQARWTLGLWGGLLITGVSLVNALNTLEQTKAAFPTIFSGPVVLVIVILAGVLGGMFEGVGVLFPAVAGYGLLQEMGRDPAPSFSRLRQGGLLTPGFAASAGRGLCIAGMMLGYEALFYYVGRKYLGVWSPAAPRYSDVLATPLPWIAPLTVGLTAAFFEEYTFRLFGVALAKRWLRWLPAALLVPAMIWAFGHSNYPVFPVWTRGLELTIVGVAFGWIFWRYDIETTVIAHYTYDALLVGWPLLHAGSSYYVVSGLVVTGLALVPALLGLIAARRGRTAPLPPDTAEPSMPADPAAPGDGPSSDVGGGATLVTALRRRPAIWMGAGLLSLLLVVVMIPRGEAVRSYRIDEHGARTLAARYLTERGFSTQGLMVGASLDAASFAAYVQEQSPAQADALLQEYPGDVWTVRFFKPLDPTTYTVELDVRTGRVVAFQRSLPQEAAASAVSSARARQVAEGFLRQNDVLPTGLNLISAQDRSYQHRVDYYFVWAKQDPRLPETRIWHEVTVQGDGVGAYRAAYVHVPEAWEHARAQRSQWAVLAAVVLVPLVLAGIVMALIYLIRRRAPWQAALWLVLAGFLLTGLPQMAGWSAGLLGYDTQMVWAAFLTLRALGWIFGPLLAGAGLAGLWTVGHVVARRQPAPLPWRQLGLGALALAGLSLGLHALVALLPGAGGAGGQAAGSYLALLTLLGIPLTALVAELLARLWLQSLLSRWLRSRLLGALAVGLVMGGVLAAGAVFVDHGSVLPALLSGLVDGLLYGLAFWVGGLPLTVTARTVQLLVQKGLLQVSAPLAPAQVVGWTALVAAVVLPFAGAWLLRRWLVPAAAVEGGEV